MKKAVLILFAVLSVCGSSAFASQPESEAKAELKFSLVSYDYGDMEYKKDARSVDISYTNTGDAPLVIIRTEQTCTCLSVKFSKKPLQPGESAVMTITYNPTKAVGEFSNYVTVFSNSDTPKQRIELTGKVIK